MKFYTSVIPHRGRLLTRAIVNGKRVKQRINYKPSLFVPVKKDTKYKTLTADRVRKYLLILLTNNESG